MISPFRLIASLREIKIQTIASMNLHTRYSYMTFSVDEADWDDYFPLIQAIIKSWYDNKGKWLGVSLPDNLELK